MADDSGTANKKPAAGWYKDPKDSTAMRRWDGERWLDEYRPRKAPKVPWSPNDYFVHALMSAVLGGVAAGLVTAADTELGLFVLYIVLSVVSIFLGIGIVAKGVEAGIRSSKR